MSKMTDLSVELVKFAWRRGRVLGGRREVYMNVK